ncbi:MAG: aminotransferase class I/II-fold pyridoxal phosphate-dependent enzyme [Bacteroidales bacterium]|jgi:dTDP-4-amino-4,6-dideoxygalactose transaminase|nr:aminotransferase class I/II-fold pyridoxal phosphate-dependent enzyme [Bacteroidales bacterium]
MNNKELFFKQKIATILETTPEHIFLYWKGRVGLYALLKAMNIQEGDEVIVPAFTCVVVANAIKYLNAKPIYVDIDCQHFNAEFEEIKKKISPKTKVIICQNTFGLSVDVEKIADFAKEHHLYSIEDCTHGFGGFYNGQPNGSYCDAAFYSTQWNKPFSTGIGGFVMTTHPLLIAALSAQSSEMVTPSWKDNLSLKLQYFAKEYLMGSYFYWTLLKLYRWLSKNNLVQGSSSGIELIGTEKPARFFKKMSKTQISKGIKTIDQLPALMVLRKKNATIYTQYLQEHHKQYVPQSWQLNHSFLLYPLLVKDREKVLAIAKKEHILIGEWFSSPLHPIIGDLKPWDLELQDFPNATHIASHILNLPTDERDCAPILAFLDHIEAEVLE